MRVVGKSLLVAAGPLAVASFPVSEEAQQAFDDFVSKFSKKYDSLEDKLFRLSTFASNYEFIKFHNMLNYSYTLGVNDFADLTRDEVRSTRFGFEVPKGRFPNLGTHRYSGATLPDAVDWVSKGAVTPVKNQKQCGSCWAFSTTGSLEGAWQIATKKLVSISEQQFVDCSTANHGCNGGSMDAAFTFAESVALCSEDDYAYKAKASTCHTSPCTSIPKGAVIGFKDVDHNSVEAMMEALSKGPVSVAIEADKRAFQMYSGGVLTSDACGTQLDHGVLAVGYGTDNQVKYWRVKNSWGDSWGEKGYIRMTQTAKDAAGECGILQMASYPEVSANSSSEILV